MWTWLVAVVAVLVAASAAAQDSDAALARWRMATWYSRTDNAALAAVELAEFRDRWAERDGDIGRLAADASEALERDDTETAIRALERIGDKLAEARSRAGVVTLADYVRAYRREVDRFGDVLATGQMDEAHRAALRNAAPALTRAAEALLPNGDGDEFRTLARQNTAAVQALVGAIDKPLRPNLELEQLTGLWHVVRANYNLLFMRYG